MVAALHLLLLVLAFALLALVIIPGAVYLLTMLSMCCLNWTDDSVIDEEAPLLTNYS